MTTDAETRIARNEDLFRRVNEAIARGVWPGEERRPAAFRCECAYLECNQAIRLSLEDYERVRANPRRFAVRPDHVLPDDEVVVEDHGGYVVVEKVGRAGQVAEELEPHS
jgi:hypothetical protein